LGCHSGCRREHKFLSFGEVLGAELRERQRRTLVIKGELARVKAKLGKSRLGEFTHAKFYVNHDWYAKCI